MVRRFRAYPDALQASVDISRLCTFDLGELQYQYPHEKRIDGLTAQEVLQRLATDAVERKFDGDVPQAYSDQIAHEMRLIGELGYAPYFLTVTRSCVKPIGAVSSASVAARLPTAACASCWASTPLP